MQAELFHDVCPVHGDGVNTQLQLVRDEVPGCTLGVDDPGSPLGWCTWMRSAAFSRDPADTILML